MKNRFLIFLLLLFGILSARAIDPNDVYMYSEQLAELDTTAGSRWGTYTSSDVPETGWIASLGTGVGTTTPGTVTLRDATGAVKILPVGTYNVFIQTYGFNNTLGIPFFECKIDLGGAPSVTVPFDDRDAATGKWTTAARMVTTVPTDHIDTLTRWLPASPSDPKSVVIRAIYITANLKTIVTSQSEIQDLSFPGTPQYDETPPIPGNYIYNSSFELGTSFGWGAWITEDREFSIIDMWSQDFAHSGKYSLAQNITNVLNHERFYISIPIQFPTNKVCTLSVWVKSTTDTTVQLRWVNTGVVLDTVNYHERHHAESPTITTTAAWNRIAITDRFLSYPESIGNVQLWFFSPTSGGRIYWDDLQLEEGDTATLYKPRYPVEFQLHSTTPGKMFYSNESLNMDLLMSNTTGTDTNLALWWDVYDTDNRLVSSRFQTTLAAKATAGNPSGNSSIPFSIDTGKLGQFRGSLYTTNHACEQEYVFSIVPPLPTPTATGYRTNGLIGTHPNFTTWQLPIMERVGSTHVRTLSPEADHRWDLVEKVNNNNNPLSYIYHDAEMQLALDAHQIIVGTLGENSPAWDKRTFIPLTGGTGTFQVGDIVTGGGFSGTVSVVLGAGNATGFAIQTKPDQVPPAVGTVLTATGGTASGATGTVKAGTKAGSPDFGEWEIFVRDMVRHYKTFVRVWEVWNEPNQDSEIPKIGSSTDDLGFYTEMANRALVQIINEDSTCQIVLMGGPNLPAFMTQVIAKLSPGWQTRVVALSAHLYDQESSGMVNFKSQITDVYGKPVWNSESSNLGGRSFYAGWGAYQPRDSIYVQEWQDTEVYLRGHRYFPESLARNLIESLGGSGVPSKWIHYDARSAIRPDIQDGLSLTGTLIDYNDTVRTGAPQIAIAQRLLEGGWGLGPILGNASANFVGYAFTNNNTGIMACWVANEATLGNISMAGRITPDKYKVLDWFGNQITITSELIPLSRQLHYVVGLNGITAGALSNAFAGATFSARADTAPPILSITLGPEGKVRYGRPVYMRAFAMDEKDMPDIKFGNVVQYATKLSPLETTFGPWKGTGSTKYAGLASGVYIYSVKARDSSGNESAVKDRKIVVLNADGSDPEGGGGGPANAAPVLTAITDKTVNELVPLLVPLVGNDTDAGQTLTYSLVSGPAGAAVTSGATANDFNNVNLMNVPGPGFQVRKASIYPHSITVSGIATPISKVTVVVTNFTHTFINDTIGMLNGPYGSSPTGATNTWLWAKVGTTVTANAGVNDVWLGFDDAAANSLPQLTAITTGTYKPTWYSGSTGVDAPGPVGPYPASLGGFIGGNANGEWRLWVEDIDYSADVGTIGGWYLKIEAGGNAFTFTPSEMQGPGTYPVQVRVTDSFSPPAFDTKGFNVIVNEVNLPPFLNPIGPKTVVANSVLTFTATASDPDIITPAQTKTFSLDPGATAVGATITAGGVFSWTPPTAGSYSVTVRVTDNGTPPLDDSEVVSIGVTPSTPGPGGTEVWVVSTDSKISYGSHVINGLGTEASPFFGDWDEIKKARVAGQTTHVGPGDYFSHGVEGFSGSNLKANEKIFGSGMSGLSMTRFIYSNSPPQTLPVSMFLSAQDVPGIQLVNFAMDLDAQAAGINGSAIIRKRNGAFVSGPGCVLRSLMATNCFGRWDNIYDEGFPLSNNTGDGNIIEDCLVTMLRGDYGSAINFRSGICRNNTVFFDPTAPPTHRYWALNFAGSTNVLAYGNKVYNAQVGVYHDTEVGKNLTVFKNEFTNIVYGIMINLTAQPDETTQTRGMDGATYATNNFFFRPDAPQVFGINFYHRTNPQEKCGQLKINFIQNVNIHSNYFGYGTGVTIPNLGVGQKFGMYVVSDVPFDGNRLVPLGINNVNFFNNRVQAQGVAGEFTFENRVSQCSVGGVPNAKNIFVNGSPLPPPPVIPVGTGGAIAAPTLPLYPYLR